MKPLPDVDLDEEDRIEDEDNAQIKGENVNGVSDQQHSTLDNFDDEQQHVKP